MTRVLLVTGSRSLATIPGAEAWEIVRRCVAEYRAERGEAPR